MGEIIKKKKNIRRYFIIFIVIILTIVYMIPLFYIVTTSFKSWSDVQQVPPTFTFKPSIGAYIRIFTARVVFTEEPTEEEIAEMTWYERIVYEETGEKIVRVGDLPKRYLNSVLIAVASTMLTIILGTIAAYGFSRFKIRGKDDLLFFILSTRMLPPVVVIIPIFLMFRYINMTDSHLTLILLCLICSMGTKWIYR